MKHWQPTDMFPISMVGAHFYRRNIAAIAQNRSNKNALVFCMATLVPESNNIHDEIAVLVRIDGLDVGHLSRADAKNFREILAELSATAITTTCDAVITAGIVTAEKEYDYIIELDLDSTLGFTPQLPTYSSATRLDPDSIRPISDGSYLATVWLDKYVPGNLHKSHRIDSWTTDHWDTINYYAAHTKNCGIGHKLLSIPKAIHQKAFGEGVVHAKFEALEGRRAVVSLRRGG